MSDLPPASGSEPPPLPPPSSADPVPNPATDLPSGWPANLSPAIPALPPLPSLDSVPQSFQAAQTPTITDPAAPVFTPAPPIPINPATAKSLPVAPKNEPASVEVDKGIVADDDDSDEVVNQPFDPALAWIVVVAATIIGLGGLAPDVRYTALWTILIVIGVLAILFDRLEVEIPTASDMAWGVGYGLLLGVPVVVIALPQLQRISAWAFAGSAEAYIFQSLVLIMPASDTLFFRGALQSTRGLFFTVGAASLWSILLFFPQLHVLEVPFVAVIIGFAFVILNFLYSYLKRRFGLFASWTCQITINLLLLFVVRYLSTGA